VHFLLFKFREESVTLFYVDLYGFFLADTVNKSHLSTTHPLSLDTVNSRKQPGKGKPHYQDQWYPNPKKIIEGVIPSVHDEQIGLVGHGTPFFTALSSPV